MGLPWRFISASAGMVTLDIAVTAAEDRSPVEGFVRLMSSPVPLRRLRMQPEQAQVYAGWLSWTEVCVSFSRAEVRFSRRWGCEGKVQKMGMLWVCLWQGAPPVFSPPPGWARLPGAG